MSRKKQPDGRTGFRKIVNAVFLFTGMSLSYSMSAQNGETIFKNTCAGCHSIGKGKVVGPDLKGVAERRSEAWILKFVKGPQAMIDGGDPDAKALAAEFPMVMPPQSVSDADIKSIIDYIKNAGGAPVATADTTPAAPVRSTDVATAAEIELGKNLFLGVQSFANGGPACISCHNVNYNGVIPGGLLAKDLTEAYSRLGGDAGLTGILGSPAFPAMQQAFADRKMTETEIYALTAFLNRVNKDTAQRKVADENPLIYGGVPGLVVIFVLVFLIWFNRKKASVKRDIYNRQVKSR